MFIVVSFVILLVISLWVIVELYIRQPIKAKWQAFANQYGLSYRRHNLNNNFSLYGSYQNYPINVYSVFPSKYRSGRSVIQVRLNGSTLGLHFFASRGIALFQRLQTNAILSDIRELDQQFEFGGEPQAQVKKILHLPTFQGLLLPVDSDCALDGIVISDCLLEIKGKFYLQEPTQLLECLTQAYQFAVEVERELIDESNSSISTNLNE